MGRVMSDLRRRAAALAAAAMAVVAVYVVPVQASAADLGPADTATVTIPYESPNAPSTQGISWTVSPTVTDLVTLLGNGYVGTTPVRITNTGSVPLKVIARTASPPVGTSLLPADGTPLPEGTPLPPPPADDDTVALLVVATGPNGGKAFFVDDKTEVVIYDSLPPGASLDVQFMVGVSGGFPTKHPGQGQFGVIFRVEQAV